jgi:hypothetical protein
LRSGEESIKTEADQSGSSLFCAVEKKASRPKQIKVEQVCLAEWRTLIPKQNESGARLFSKVENRAVQIAVGSKAAQVYFAQRRKEHIRSKQIESGTSLAQWRIARYRSKQIESSEVRSALWRIEQSQIESEASLTSTV